MASIVTISAATERVRCQAGGSAKHVFVVKNSSARTLTIGAQAVPVRGGDGTWYVLMGKTERQLAPAESDQYAVEVRPPEGADLSTCTFHLLVYDTTAPGEDFTQGPTVGVEIEPPAKPREPRKAGKFPWWVLTAALGVIALIAGMVVFWPSSAPGTEVVSTSPEAEATNVAVSATVEATFSQPLDAAASNGAGFTLHHQGGQVAGTVTFSEATVSFEPQGALAPGTRYTASVGDAIKSIAGGPAQPHTWSFITAAPVDREAPTIEGTAPADGAARAEPGGTIRVTFSEPMAPASLNTGTFVVTRGGEPLEGVVSTSGAVATFTPIHRLALLADYQVKITTGAQDQAGNALGREHRFRFKVREGRWLDRPQRIDINQSGTAISGHPRGDRSEGVSLATNARGDAVAVWQQVEGAEDGIWARGFSNGSWQEPSLLAAGDITNLGYPRVALDDQGNAIAAWPQSDGTRMRMRAARYDAARGAWSAGELIEASTDGSAVDPQVQMDAAGNAIVVWSQSGQIHHNRYTAGSGWQAEDHTISGDYRSRLGLAVAAGGDAVACWVGTGNTIWAARYSPSLASLGWGTWQLVTTSPKHASAPSCTVDSRGTAILVWWEYKSDGASTIGSVYARRHRRGADWATGWDAAVQLNANAGASDNSVHNLRVALNASGVGAVTWRRQASPDQVRVRLYGTAGWSSATTRGTARYNGYAGLGSDAGGNLMLLWRERAAPGAISVNRFRADARSWAGPAVLSGSSDQVGGPALALSPQGHALVGWVQRNGDAWQVLVTRFE